MSPKRRLNLSSGYIGSGNKPSVFNRKPKTAFQKIREKYATEYLKLTQEKDLSRDLSKDEKLQLKHKITAQIKQEKRKGVLKIILTIIATALAFYTLILLINNLHFLELQ